MQYPASLLQAPLRASFADAAPETVIRSQNDSGPRKARQRYTAAERPLSCTVLLRSQAEKDLLDNWFQYTLAGGALPFVWPALGPALGERNLLNKGSFADLQRGLWTGTGSTIQSTTEAWGGFFQALQRDNSENAPFDVTPGQRLFTRLRMRSTGCTYPLAFNVAFANASGAIFVFGAGGDLPANTGWTLVTASCPVPDGAVSGRGYLVINGPASTNIGPAGFAELSVSTSPLDARYSVVARPAYRLAGARVWTADLQLVRLP